MVSGNGYVFLQLKYAWVEEITSLKKNYKVNTDVDFVKVNLS